jgi:transcriptional regulator EpsA
MSDDQRIVLMDLMAESLRINNRSNLFNWVQGNFQYLLNHEIMIFGVKLENDDYYSFEYSASTRYFKVTHFNESVKEADGVINQAIKRWNDMRLPLFYCNTLVTADYNKYSVQRIDESILQNTELKNFVVHGFGDDYSKVSTLVVFARISGIFNAIQAHFLELIMPHLHCALVRIFTTKANYTIQPSKRLNKITERELEILRWVQMGKTNWEISTILAISPLTVKNHVQNILRKLDAQNRGQAAAKATKLGLIDMMN